ncbi:MAG: glycine zipper 2TM domain-containing protein [Bdellovibrionales bacterium]|nr:glycine zipper 2TM domain-containing protein [Bdellovibrionales bacterium]
MFKKIIIAITLTIGLSASLPVAAQSCTTPTIIGGLIGAGLGSLFNNHKDAAMIGGSLLGGSIANDSCEEDNSEQRVGLYPQPGFVYYPGNLYKPANCQVVTQVINDGYGGYYTQWQEICN